MFKLPIADFLKIAKRKYVLFFSVFIVLIFSFSAILVRNYTNTEITEIVKNVTANYYPFENCSNVNNETEYVYYHSDVVNPMYLFDLLYYNNSVISNRFYGDATMISESYSKEWCDEICMSPTFIKTAWSLMGESAIRQINSRLQYYKDHPSTASTSFIKACYQSDNFSTQKFWRSEMNLLARYKKLLTELEALNENDLNIYINSCNINDRPSSYEFEQWMIQKKLISEESFNSDYSYCMETPSNNSKYPGDLIMLIKRVCEIHNNGSLTPRKCIFIAKNIINDIQETIKRVGYVL